MPLTCKADFLSIFKAQREHCRALLELSRRQAESIDQNDYAQLLEILSRKQRLLGSLDELNRNRPSLREEWRSQRDGIETELRHECEVVLADAETMLAEILGHEQSDTQTLVARRDETQRQLEAVSQGTQIHSAYRDSLAPATHRHLDVNQ